MKGQSEAEKPSQSHGQCQSDKVAKSYLVNPYCADSDDNIVKIVTDYSLITRSLGLSDKPDRIGSNAENEKSCWTINMLIHHCFSSLK